MYSRTEWRTVDDMELFGCDGKINLKNKLDLQNILQRLWLRGYADGCREYTV
jgi:hypothetical protein